MAVKSRLGRLGRSCPAISVLFFACVFLAAAGRSDAQETAGRLWLPASLSGGLVLGGKDRVVTPVEGRWRLMLAPPGAVLGDGVLLRDGDTVFAGTVGTGLLVFDSGGSSRSLGMEHGLAGDRVRALAGSASRLFVGTDGGLSIWDGSTFKTFTPHNSVLPAAPVDLVDTDGRGGAWVACKGGLGVHVDDDDQMEAWPDPGLGTGERVLALGRFAGNGLAVATNRSLRVLRDGRWSAWSLPFEPRALVPVPAGAPSLLIGGSDGLFRFQVGDGGGELFQVAERGTAVDGIFLASGQVWISAGGRISVPGTVVSLSGSGRPVSLRKLGTVPGASFASGGGVRPYPAPGQGGGVSRGTTGDAGEQAGRRVGAPVSMDGLFHAGGRLFGFGRDGLFEYDGGRWVPLWSGVRSGAGAVTAAVGDSDGRIWIALSSGRVLQWNGSKWVEMSASGRIDGPVRAMTLEPGGNRLQVLTGSGTLVELSTR